jgi:AraC family transcriptional regulator
LAKIAVGLKRALADRVLNGAPRQLAARTLAQGDGWTVEDVICTSGPRDRAFEEQHRRFSIAMVLAGSFQYRGSNASRRPAELMTPGSLLLGSPGQYFECSHEHAAGDRCISFRYSPEYFEQIAGDAGARKGKPAFPVLKVSPVRNLTPLLARACAFLEETPSSICDFHVAWEELGIELAAIAGKLANAVSTRSGAALPSAIARVTDVVRTIEDHLGTPLPLARLARESRLSPYHFLRIFEQVTGVTPHQYIRRMRLREAAIRLSTGREKVLDLALDCGFNDPSNFCRAFVEELGATPRVFRRGDRWIGGHTAKATFKYGVSRR